MRALVPSSPNVFVGRAAELARFDASADSVRLTLIYGVAGIGKTSFMLRSCERLAHRKAASLDHVRCRPGDAVMTIAQSALEQLGYHAGAGPHDALDALIAYVRAAPLVLCVDDLHLLGDASAVDDLVTLANARLPLWVCLASREVLPVSPRVIDHLVLRLDGLTSEEMRELWGELELLYGPAATTLDDVVARGGGNPLLFKQAFADPLAALPADPLGLAHLPAFEAAILAELCAFRVPVELSALVNGRDNSQTLRALGFLARRFLVDIRGTTFGVHDLVRETVLHSRIAPGVREHRRAFDYYAGTTAVDQVTPATLELLHHALGCGEDDLAERILATHLSQPSTVLPPPTRVDHELSEAFALLATRRPPTLRMHLEAIRIRARQGDATDALRELQAATAECADDPFVAFACGDVAFLAGDLELAATSLERAAADERLLLPARLWALVLFSEVARVLGRADRALAYIEQQRALIAACGPIGDALVDAMLATMAWERDDSQTCLERSRSAHRNLARSGLTLPSFRLFTALSRSARVRLGLPLEPGDALLEPFDEPPLIRALMHILRVIDLTNLGLFREAHALAQSILDSPVGAHPSLALTGLVNACISRAVLESPDAVLPAIDAASDAALRCHQPLHRMRLEALACQLLVATDQHALALRRGQAALALGETPGSAVGWLRAVLELARAAMGEPCPPPSASVEPRSSDRARQELILLEAALMSGHAAAVLAQAQDLEAVCTRAGWRWFACRARLLGAEAAFHRGDFVGASAALARVHEEAHQQGYLSEALHAELLEVALLRARGDVRSAEQRIASLFERTRARGDKREAEALRVVLERLRGDTALLCTSSLTRRLHFDAQASLRISRSDGVWHLAVAQLDRIDRAPMRLIVDLFRQQIVVDGNLEDMRRRETLIPLVRALLVAPSMRLPPEDLVKQAWGFEYHPLNHRSRLSMAITRLRKLLGPDLFVSTRDGYALHPPRPWMLIELL
jgi:hypothetical protein